MINKADEAFIDALIEENRELREIIRQRTMERIEAERYWKNFILKLIEKGIIA